jgi:hypothetical protein
MKPSVKVCSDGTPSEEVAPERMAAITASPTAPPIVRTIVLTPVASPVLACGTDSIMAFPIAV